MPTVFLFLIPEMKEMNPTPLLRSRLVILRFTPPMAGHCAGLSVKITLGRVVMLILPPPGSGQIIDENLIAPTDSKMHALDNAGTFSTRKAATPHGVFNQLRISNAPGSTRNDNCQFTFGMLTGGIRHQLSLANPISLGPHEVIILSCFQRARS